MSIDSIGGYSLNDDELNHTKLYYSNYPHRNNKITTKAIVVLVRNNASAHYKTKTVD